MTNVDIEFLQITSQGGSLFKLYAVFIGGRLLLKDGLCMRKFPNHSTILSILLAIFRLFSVKLLDHHSQNPNLAKKFCLEGPGVSHLFSRKSIFSKQARGHSKSMSPSKSRFLTPLPLVTVCHRLP